MIKKLLHFERIQFLGTKYHFKRRPKISSKLIVIDGLEFSKKHDVATYLSEKLRIDAINVGEIIRYFVTTFFKKSISTYNYHGIIKVIRSTKIEITNNTILYNGFPAREQIYLPLVDELTPFFLKNIIFTSEISIIVGNIVKHKPKHIPLIVYGSDIASFFLKNGNLFFLESSIENRAKRKEKYFKSHDFEIDENEAAASLESTKNILSENLLVDSWNHEKIMKINVDKKSIETIGQTILNSIKLK